MQPSAGEANPAIRKGRLNVKKKHLHIRPLSIAGFEVFVTAFFLFFTKTIFCYLRQKSPLATFYHFCLHFALPLLDKTLTPLKGKIKQKKTGL